MPVSRDYQKYLEDELIKREPTFYEKISNKLGGKIPIKIPLSLDKEQEIWQKLQFVGYRTSPQNIYRSALMIFIIGIIIGTGLIFLNTDSIFIILAIGGSGAIAFYWTVFLNHVVTFTRIRATADLLVSVLYIVISLRLTPNFENALIFASMNTKGVVGRDLKKIAWDLSLRKYDNADQALEVFADKWKEQNQEFSEAMDILRTSVFKTESSRSKLYEEAINIILERNTDRMKNYTQKLSQPLAIINYMGITLPVLTIILFPILTIFLTEAVPPYLLVIVYNIVLPILVWFLINDTLSKRPMAFGSRDVSNHPDAHAAGEMMIKNRKIKVWPFAILISIGFFSLGFFLIFSSTDVVSLQKILGGNSIIWGIVAPIVFYSYFSYKGNDKIRKGIVETENEFATSLFELGLILQSGYSVETSIEKLLNKIRNLKISELFGLALRNIRNFGYTFEKSIFDPEVGVIKFYPSSTIKNILKVFSESLKKGSRTTASAMISISNYMKNVSRVETFLREMMSETTSEMNFMMGLLVPVAMGIIIGLSALLSLVLFNVSTFFVDAVGLTESLPIGDGGLISVLGDIDKVVPIEWLTVIVGVYMIEVLLSLAFLISTLKYGEDPIERYKTIAKGLFMGTFIFTLIGIITFVAFQGIVDVGIIG